MHKSRDEDGPRDAGVRDAMASLLRDVLSGVGAELVGERDECVDGRLGESPGRIDVEQQGGLGSLPGPGVRVVTKLSSTHAIAWRPTNRWTAVSFHVRPGRAAGPAKEMTGRSGSPRAGASSRFAPCSQLVAQTSVNRSPRVDRRAGSVSQKMNGQSSMTSVRIGSPGPGPIGQRTPSTSSSRSGFVGGMFRGSVPGTPRY
jgi:hypothetical protein